MPSYFDQTERGHVDNFSFIPVAVSTLAQEVHQKIFIAVVFHVNEVDNYNPAQVAQSQLLEDKFGRLQICFQNRFVKIRAPDKFAGVHVDCGQSLCLVDDDLPAARQRKFALIQVGNLFRNAERLKNLRGALVKNNFGVGRKLNKSPINFQVVDNKFGVGREVLAQKFFKQVIIVVEERGRLAFRISLKNSRPKFLERGKVFEQNIFVATLSRRPND